MKKIFIFIVGLLFIATLSNAQLANDGLSGGSGGGSACNNDAYDATAWNGDSSYSPCKDAVRDKFESLGTASAQNVGTLTNTYLCTFVTGTGIVCNTAPTTYLLASTIVAAGDVLVGSGAGAATVITKGANNSFFGVNNSGTLGFYTSFQLDDAAAQFISATASKGYLKVLLSGSTNGKTLTTSFLHTDDKTLYFPDPTTGDSVTYGSAAIRLNTGGSTARVKTLSDNASTIIEGGTGYTTIVKTEYIPIAYAEDGAAAPATATIWADTRKSRVRVFAADADKDVEIHWIVPDDYVGGIKFRVIGFVDNATAPANTETIIFNLAGCSVGASDDGGCTLGTGVNSTFTADATYAQHDRWSSSWSSEITVTNILAGESAMLKLFRDVDDTYGQGIAVAGIEIKYKAKIMLDSTY